jgi:hypothetical protein
MQEQSVHKSSMKLARDPGIQYRVVQAPGLVLLILLFSVAVRETSASAS